MRMDGRNTHLEPLDEDIGEEHAHLEPLDEDGGEEHAHLEPLDEDIGEEHAHLEPLDENGGEEHTGEDEAGIDCGISESAQVGLLENKG
jgi:hypothetical protein